VAGGGGWWRQKYLVDSAIVTLAKFVEELVLAIWIFEFGDVELVRHFERRERQTETETETERK